VSPFAGASVVSWVQATMVTAAHASTTKNSTRFGIDDLERDEEY
jgi:hypothetical protein